MFLISCVDYECLYLTKSMSSIMQGNAVHGQIFHPLIQKFKPLLTEGKVYYLESYRVKDANRLYKPVPNEYMITFTRWTEVDECIDVPADYPSVVYSLTPYTEIPKLVDTTNFFVGKIHYHSSLANPLKHCVPLVFKSFPIEQILWE